jgi:hypothetical protein
MTLLAAAGSVIASAVALGPAAAADAHVQACVTSTITTGPRDGVGTTATKSSTSSCGDLNLTYADDPFGWDLYAGRYYRSSTGTWVTGSAGYIGVSDGSYAVDEVVLVTDLRGGTRFTVASYWDAGDTVRITH